MRLTVGKKFGGLALLSALLIVIISGGAFIEIGNLARYFQSTRSVAKQAQDAQSLLNNLIKLDSDIRGSIAAHDPAALQASTDALVPTIMQQASELSQAFTAANKLAEANSIESLRATFESDVQKILGLAKEEDWNAASLRLDNNLLPTQNRIEQQVQAINSSTNSELQNLQSAVERVQQRALLVIIGSVLGALALISVVSFLIRNDLLVPLQRLTASATALAAGTLSARSNLPARSDEIGTLAAAFDSMGAALQRSQHNLEEQISARTAELQAERASLEQALQDIQRGSQERDQLLEQLSHAQNPVIPITERVLIAPLVGQINLERLNTIQTAVLDAVATRRAQVIIMDVTGVPVLDAASAASFITMEQALRLIGARMLVVGLRPDVAESLVSAGITSGELWTAADLQAGILKVQALHSQQRS